MPNQVTAQQVIERIQKNLGAPWKDTGPDGFYAGNPKAVVTGIVTTYAPSLEVLRRAVAARKNLIISREAPFWDREEQRAGFSGAGAPPKKDEFLKDAAYRFKQDFIESNNLAVYRLTDNWDARKVNGQLRGLAMALGWDKHRKGSGEAYSGPFDYFTLPSSSLNDLAKGIQKQLKTKAIRVIGDPQTRISKVALSTGFFLVPQLNDVITRDPSVEGVVIGEPVEWEASPYFQDLLASGRKMGMLALGQEVSEEPGCGEMAAWLKSFISDVPVEFMPAGEPFWTLA